ncbi:MAG TPA: ATP-binding protein [Gemmatimonadaceae bacterium]|nr:ATP-binding protein [Gemmatimonadaceae bacterium]
MTTIATEPPTGSGPIPLRARRLQLFTSLRMEILLSLAMLGATALVIAVFTVLLLDTLATSRFGVFALVAMIVADVLVLVLFGAYKIRGLVLDPLDEIIETAEAISRGDLTRRAAPAASMEFARLAKSVNRMTVHLLESQARHARLEKMAGVGTLAAGVAHEIGNPLGAISGYAHLLRRGVHNDATLVEALTGIERESARIDRIVRGMLEYARPRSRTTALVDINASVHRAVELLTTQGKLRDIELHLNLSEGLPQLMGDLYEMDQVFVNLLLNAVQVLEGSGRIEIATRRVPFTPAADDAESRADDTAETAIERIPSARVRAWLNTVGEPQEVIEAVIADSGPGVSEPDRERIFDPFFTTKAPGQGTGLGLSIVARVVEGLGGTVWVRPSREGGAAFVMMFPVAERSTVSGSGDRTSQSKQIPSVVGARHAGALE